jgi:hypothetical protein
MPATYQPSYQEALGGQLGSARYPAIEGAIDISSTPDEAEDVLSPWIVHDADPSQEKGLRFVKR